MKKLLIILFGLMVYATAYAQNDSTTVVDEILPDSTTLTQRAHAGPKTTPVDVDDNKPRVIMHYYDKHGNPLNEPVMFLASLDTVTKVKSKPVYPTYNGVNVGLNFGDLIFMAFGQKHASFDVWANVSLWNWLFPTLECGLGYINDTPDKMNYTYKSGPSMYAKIGFNYNFLYKSNPAYQFFVGFRAGFSNFKYDVTDIRINSEYWEESQNLSLTGLKSTCWYGEVLAPAGQDSESLLAGMVSEMALQVQRVKRPPEPADIRARLRLNLTVCGKRVGHLDDTGSEKAGTHRRRIAAEVTRLQGYDQPLDPVS